MKLAVIVISQLGDLQKLHKFLPDYKLVDTSKTPTDPKIVLHLNLQDQQKILQYISFLKLYNYSIKGIVVQDNSQADYKSIIYQLKCFEILHIIVGQDNDDSFMQRVVAELTSSTWQYPLYDAATIPIQPLTPAPSIFPPKSDNKDNNDRRRLIHGREIHEGNAVGRYLQPPPMLWGRDGHNIWMGDMYRGGSAFLILGGPSFGQVDKTKLSQAGILTMGVNNSPKTFRPNMWISVDDPSHFIKSIWLDPKITKFVPYSHSEKVIFDNEAWKELDMKAGDCPNVWYFKRNEHFKANQFLFEDTINWGNHKDHGGGRSVMLAAIRILYYLGIRTIYLLGCDFKMDENTKYHFEQDRAEGSIKGNNSTYELLVERFQQLKPIFEDNGLNVYNCNKASGLMVFPFIEFEEAIKIATANLPSDLSQERTAGLYERTAHKKDKKNAVK